MPGVGHLPPAHRRFGVYLGLFLSIWTAYVLLVYRHLQALGDDSLLYAVANMAVRLTVWVGPVILMLWFIDRVAPLRALGLVDRWKRGVLIGICLFALLLAIALLQFGWPHGVARRLTWQSVLGTSFGVGFYEEIPFRGYILQKLGTRMNFWLANALTSVIFVGMHLPGWLMLNLFALRLALYVFAFSFVLGAVFHYSRSLWSCIIGHSANNLVSAVLFGGR